MPTQTDAPFQLRSLLTESGTASNGEKLVNTLAYHHPPELRAALLRRENTNLTPLDDDQIAHAAKIAGVDHESDEIEFAATVRGGETRPADAWVTYAYYDKSGDLWKGAFPFSDLGRSSSKRHISQSESLASSPAARDFAEAEEKRRAGASDEDVEQLQARIAALEAQQGGPTGPVETADPVAALADADAQELVRLMEEHPERADAVKAFEQAHRGEKARKTVLDWKPAESEE